jgi:hypothetical protein
MLSVNIHEQEVKAFASGIEIVRFHCAVEISVPGVKKAFKYPYFVFIGNTDTRILCL